MASQAVLAIDKLNKENALALGRKPGEPLEESLKRQRAEYVKKWKEEQQKK